ncbi:MAG: ThiF family adenylyltransferase [Phycisphaerales bacterium]|nr:ThiF family adenylyltransferase [Phycisphaerales bacterium]
MSDLDPSLARYSRQILYRPWGEAAQKRLTLSKVALVGCGALGTVLANTLVRAGVGAIRIIDRDYVEIDNLQRQVLFDEADIAANLPKAEAAARKLRRVNSGVEIDAVVADVNPSNVESLCTDADLILDGTDNFETRFLINDVAVKNALPWVYGACVGSEGLVMPILPRRTPCLRCIWESAPPPGMSPTCDTAGVLGSLVNVVASMQALEAMKILAGKEDALVSGLTSIDVWSGRVRTMDMQAARDDGDCPCCKRGRYEYLSGDRTSAAVTLCGRNAVQINPAAEGGRASVELKALAATLRSGKPTYNEFLLRVTIDGHVVTVFPDGRAIIKGTSDPAVARSIFSKYIGV